MSKVMIMDHPLIQHKIGIIRRQETGSKDFRQLISEIAMLMCYEATRDLKLTDVEIDTPISHMTAKELAGKKLAVVPILRAGLGFIDIDACIEPVAVSLDEFAVMADLCGQRVKHSVLAAGNTGVGCDSLFTLQLRRF